MKRRNRYLILSAVLFTGAAIVFDYLRKLKREGSYSEISVPEDDESLFLREWTEVLTTYGDTFTGLYAGLKRVSDGNAKRPEKFWREWCQRTHNKWENQSVDELCQKNIVPLIEGQCGDELRKWANILMNAATEAGISFEQSDCITLNGAQTLAYTEWDDNEIFEGDMVEIIAPAWYQNSCVLEMGQCKVKNIE